MSRIPRANPTDLASDAAEQLRAAAPNRDRPLNLHAEMASAPAVLSAYMGLRKAIVDHGSLDPKTHTAIMFTVASLERCEYAQALNGNLLRRAGWNEDQIATLGSVTEIDDRRLEALLAVVRAATTAGGRVADGTWQAALDVGWTAAQLADAYVSLSLAAFVDHFLAFAETTLDVPAPEPAITPAT